MNHQIKLYGWTELHYNCRAHPPGCTTVIEVGVGAKLGLLSRSESACANTLCRQSCSGGFEPVATNNLSVQSARGSRLASLPPSFLSLSPEFIARDGQESSQESMNADRQGKKKQGGAARGLVEDTAWCALMANGHGLQSGNW